MMNIKNAALSPAAFDLGLGQGDILQDQVDEATKERQKKSSNGPLMGDGTNALLTSSFSPAVAALLSKAGGGIG